MIHRLWQEAESEAEQISIGVAAKMANGLLLTLLGLVVLTNYRADLITRAVFALSLAALYAANFVMFYRDPARAVNGYRG